MTTLANRIHAFLHPLDAVQLLQKSFDSERRIWTEKGHVLVSELKNDVQWVVHPDGKGIDFIDRWLDKAGEEVSRAVHVYDQSQMSVTSETVAGDVK